MPEKSTLPDYNGEEDENIFSALLKIGMGNPGGKYPPDEEPPETDMELKKRRGKEDDIGFYLRTACSHPLLTCEEEILYTQEMQKLLDKIYSHMLVIGYVDERIIDAALGNHGSKNGEK